MLINACIASSTAMGEHCTVPQADSVALLFTHDANDKAAANTFCRHRPLNGFA